VEALQQLKRLDGEIQTLKYVAAGLGWDQQVLMPQRAVTGRAEQLALIATLIHQKETTDEIGRLLEDLGASDEHPFGSDDLAESDRAYVRAFYRDYRQATRIPAELVERITRVTAVAQSVWAEARKKSDFSLFESNLAEIVDLSIEVADRLGYKEHPYDALIDQYEPGMSTADIARIFRELREGLVPLVRKIKESGQVEHRFMLKAYAADEQERFGRKVLDAMKFDSSRGRLDISIHPFTTSLGSDDVRITTRYHEDRITSSLFSIVHEAGHGLYEQGFSPDHRGTRLHEAASLGIHESMSRFWENVVGRSRPFWHHFYPIVKEHFPQQLSGVDVEQFYRAVNMVEPSHIRVEADEITYSLHVILRFELERMLVGKELTVKELPDAWREQSRDLLGIVPQRDADGVLQDIHWSGGAIGYFPTYALGNVYGLQFVSKLRSDMPDFDDQIRSGELGNIKTWLDTNVHTKGRTRTPKELCEEISGKPLSAHYFIDYLTEKYAGVYAI
jgi:carboxypeptidase Taq